MLRTALILLAAFGVGGGVAYLNCDGCYRDSQTWGGGAAGEVWTYTPGAGDQDGECTPTCGWDVPCKYTGNLSFTNNGTGARDVLDNSGNVIATVQIGGKWGPNAVNVNSGCGATGNAAGQYQAQVPPGVAGANPTSAYMFYCTGCFEI